MRHYFTSLNGWLVFLTVGTVLPVLVFAAVTLWSVLAAHERQEHAAVLDRARTLASALDAELRAAKAAATTLATSQALEEGRLADFYLDARRVAERSGGWVVMSDGQDPPQEVLNTVRPYGAPLPRGNRATLAVFRDKAPLVLDPFVGTLLQRPVIAVAVPIFREGEVSYCLNLDLSPDRFSWLLAQHGFGPAVAGINDRQHRIVARSADADQWLAQRAPEWLPVAGSETSGLVENATVEGRPVHVVFQRLTEVPWMVYLAVPSADPPPHPLVSFLGIAVLLGAAAVGVAVVVARRIGRPITDMALHAAALVRGDPTDLRLHTPIQEVRQLHGALFVAGEKARAYQRELEARVVDRTAVLDDALAAARIANSRLEEANAELRQEGEERRRAETARRESEEKFTTIFAASPVALSLTSLQTGRHLEVNDAWVKLFGYSRTEAVGRTVAELRTWKHPEKRPPLLGALGSEVARSLASHEVEFVKKSGATFTGLLSWHPFPLGGEVVLVAAIVDLTESTQREAELRRALAHEQAAVATNVTLLREVHHRVKNNLQMLCDLLYLQMEGMADEEKAGVLRDTYGRIYAIARLHEQIYQAMASGQVPLSAYLGRLVAGFENMYRAIPVQLEIGDDRVALDVDRAIHTGLIVNELITNALKHAFPHDAPGRVVVRLHRVEDTVEIQVRDTGRGLPADLDLTQAKSLGLRIVHILTQRLKASVSIENAGGAAFTIRFPLKAEE